MDQFAEFLREVTIAQVIVTCLDFGYFTIDWIRKWTSWMKNSMKEWIRWI